MNYHYYFHCKETVTLRSALGKGSPLDSASLSPRSGWGWQLRLRESVGCCLPCSSRPVVDIITAMSFSPAEIPVHEVECSYSTSDKKKEGVNITVCFQVKSLISQFKGQCCLPASQLSCLPQIQAHGPRIRRHSTLAFPPCPGHLVANLTYTLQLDGHRSRSRGLFPDGKHELSRNTAVTSVKSCTGFWFHFPVRSQQGCSGQGRGGRADHSGRQPQCQARLHRCPAQVTGHLDLLVLPFPLLYHSSNNTFSIFSSSP